ncbi:hypothetical protein CLV59_109158 [Chitinophaga dinghuensis]|uniref:Uncharacterized protein n=1 Tax=Chitinophaga dinghuensis TaxID=1539050 RepID=A0A327VL99_9BACT|nr:hypothetical protein CLV59_109158 [Chitinophaga dinghuensis]
MLLLCLYTPLLFGQSNISTNRIVIKDSLSLDGKWIKRINNDSTLKTAGEQSLSTDGALKKYIDKVASGGGMSREELVNMLINPNCLEVRFQYSSRPITDTSEKFTIHIESSDGIKTDYDISGYYPWEIFYAYGAPPFKMDMEVKNTTIDSVLYFYMSASNRLMQYNIKESAALSGDTVKLHVTDLKGQVDISIGTYKLEDEFYFQPIKETFRNHSKNQVLGIGRNGSTRIFTLPGKEESQIYYWTQPNQNTIYIEAYYSYTTKNGDYFVFDVPNSELRLKIYKNGALLREETLPKMIRKVVEVPMDSSWTDYEIVLEDV